MKKESGVPFVARHRTAIPGRESASSADRYDTFQQLWVNADSGEPLVNQCNERRNAGVTATQFGETMMTKTMEGVDQAEGQANGNSHRAPADLIHAGERRLLTASPFGETMMTESGEGADQSERSTNF